KTASWVGRNRERESLGDTCDRRAAASRAGAANEARTAPQVVGCRSSGRRIWECPGRTKIVAPAMPAATCRSCVPPSVSLSLPAPIQEAALGRRYRHAPAPLARPVELDEHDRLPGAEQQTAVLHGNGLARTEHRGLDVRRRIAVDPVVPPDPGGHETVE